jgi:hypothetical protein
VYFCGNIIVGSSLKAEVTPYRHKVDMTLVLQGIVFPAFLDSRQMKMERSAVRTDRLYPEVDTPGTDFC